VREKPRKRDDDHALLRIRFVWDNPFR
jgi:hypothetical protein